MNDWFSLFIGEGLIIQIKTSAKNQKLLGPSSVINFNAWHSSLQFANLKNANVLALVAHKTSYDNRPLCAHIYSIELLNIQNIVLISFFLQITWYEIEYQPWNSKLFPLLKTPKFYFLIKCPEKKNSQPIKLSINMIKYKYCLGITKTPLTVMIRRVSLQNKINTAKQFILLIK